MHRVKVSFNRETKKVPQSVTNYAQLCGYIKVKAFIGSAIPVPGKFQLYYQDKEGDLISISNNDELENEISSFL